MGNENDNNDDKQEGRLKRKINQMLTKRKNFVASFVSERNYKDTQTTATPKDRKNFVKNILDNLADISNTNVAVINKILKTQAKTTEHEIGNYLLDKTLTELNKIIDDIDIENFDNKIKVLTDAIYNIHHVILNENTEVLTTDKELNTKFIIGFKKNTEQSKQYANMLPNKEQRHYMEINSISSKSICDNAALDNKLQNK